MPNSNAATIESAEVFCRRLSQRLSEDGFDFEIKPGCHLVDNAGADSIVVLHYVLILQEFGLNIDLETFDINLLDTDVAYKQCMRNAVAHAVAH